VRRRPAAGFTLVEVIVAIAIIAVAVGGVMLVFVVALTHSADPQQQQQAVAIAEGYLDEILSRAYDDPDGTDAGETRGTFDDVLDYDGLDQAPRDQDGGTLAGLGSYRVRVTVVDSSALGPPGQTVPARRIDVRVTAPPLVDTTISAYRVPD
jgi:MSHA pilin protein MshD